MSEQNKERIQEYLPDEDPTSPTSDEAIRARLGELQEEVGGLSHPPIIEGADEIGTGDNYPPKLISTRTSALTVAKNTNGNQIYDRNLTFRHSASGLRILERRLRKKSCLISPI